MTKDYARISRLQKVMADEALGLLDLQGLECVLDVGREDHGQDRGAASSGCGGRRRSLGEDDQLCPEPLGNEPRFQFPRKTLNRGTYNQSIHVR